MKTKATLIALVLALGFSANAQVINPKKIVKQKVEDRTNRTTDRTIDKGLDKIEIINLTFNSDIALFCF